MRLFYQQKIIGKKARKLAQIPFTVTDPVHTLQDLLIQLVTQQVTAYNNKTLDIPLYTYVTDEQLADAVEHGKVHFDTKTNEAIQSIDKAIATMQQAFEDELFLVLHNDVQLTSLTAPLAVQEDDVFTFIKLTMLAGRIW